MFFIHPLIDDIPEIINTMETAETLGEPIVFASCINPLSIALSIAEESVLTAYEIGEAFSEFVADLADSNLFGNNSNIDISPEMMVEWINSITGSGIGIIYDDISLLDMVVRKNNEAIHDMFFRNVSGIQIVLTPANAKGNTLSIAGDYRADSISLLNKLYDAFGEFVMVCFPLEINIGPTGHKVNQFICHIYNDNNTSFTRGSIMQGSICPVCGEFYTTFPGQTEFCCKL